jgi:mannosyltransferase
MGEEATVARERREFQRLVIVALVAFAAFRLAGLVRYPLWTDETWTLNAGNGSLRAMLRIHADDQTHPPLFYAVLWAWRRIGPDATWWHRLLPCIAGIATAIPLMALARGMGLSSRGRWLAAIIGAGSGILVAYSAELRNYAFYAFFATASLALWVRARPEESPRLAPLTIVNILLIYSHFFGLLIIAAEIADALLFARRRLRALLLSSGVVLLALVPWIAAAIRRARITGERLDVVSWIPVPRAGDMLDIVRESIGGWPSAGVDLALVTVACALVAAWIAHNWKREPASSSRSLALAVLVPVLVTWVFSVVGPRSAWLPRYLIGVAPALVVLLAGAIDWAVPRRVPVAAFALALLPGMLTAWSLVRGTAKPRFDLVAEGMYAVEGMKPYAALSFSAVEGLPLIAAAKRVDPGIRVAFADAGAPVEIDSGWIVWSERNPPKGLTPSARLVRQGFSVGPALGFRADDDSLVAVKFARAVRP